MSRLDSDFRVRTGFFNHYKTKLLYARLGPGGPYHLLQLWAWTTENRPDGNLAGIPDEAIALVAGWPGEPNVFIGALVEAHFLDGEPGSRVIHDWQEHQPWIQTRAALSEAGRRAMQKRWKRESKSPTSTPTCPNNDNQAITRLYPGYNQAITRLYPGYNQAISRLYPAYKEANNPDPDRIPTRSRSRPEPGALFPETENLEEKTNLIYRIESTEGGVGGDQIGASAPNPRKRKKAKPKYPLSVTEDSDGNLHLEGMTEDIRQKLLDDFHISSEQLDSLVAEMLDYAASKPKWRAERSRGNWLATLRNWIRRSLDRGEVRQQSPPKTRNLAKVWSEILHYLDYTDGRSYEKDNAFLASLPDDVRTALDACGGLSALDDVSKRSFLFKTFKEVLS